MFEVTFLAGLAVAAVMRSSARAAIGRFIA